MKDIERQARLGHNVQIPDWKDSSYCPEPKEENSGNEADTDAVVTRSTEPTQEVDWIEITTKKDAKRVEALFRRLKKGDNYGTTTGWVRTQPGFEEQIFPPKCDRRGLKDSELPGPFCDCYCVPVCLVPEHHEPNKAMQDWVKPGFRTGITLRSGAKLMSREQLDGFNECYNHPFEKEWLRMRNTPPQAEMTDY